MPKAFLIDTTRCTACRGCQVACKEWKNHASLPTKQRGSHQNPPDFTPVNFKLVRFAEHMVDGKVAWCFFPDQCRHCLYPNCLAVATDFVKDCATFDEKTGAVLYNEKIGQLTKEQAKEVIEACPYNVPRRDEATGMLTKCDMCIDRVQANRLPMCVKTCAMGAMNFGEREAMLKLAEERLAVVKKKLPKAQLLDKDALAVIYLVADDPKLYHKYAVAQAPAPMSRKQFFAKVFAPARGLART
ncbi:MAG: 4Fe-4S dicluster domain-containing protein [Thermodesulfobacteriota bacterium]